MKIESMRIKTQEEGYQGGYPGDTEGGQKIVRWEEMERSGDLVRYRCYITDKRGREDYWFFPSTNLILTYEGEKFNTRPRTIPDKCQPDIRAALEQNREIECMVWDSDGEEKEREWVLDYISEAERFPYKTPTSRFIHAEPIEKETKKTFLKKASELITFFEKKGYECDDCGDWVHSMLKNFEVSNFQYCGKEVPAGTAWPDAWVVIKTEPK